MKPGANKITGGPNSSPDAAATLCSVCSQPECSCAPATVGAFTVLNDAVEKAAERAVAKQLTLAKVPAAPLEAFELSATTIGVLNGIESPDEPPTEFRMLKAGLTRMRKGGRIFNVLLDEDAKMSILGAFADQGREALPVDYDHGMLGMISTADSSAAAGWFKMEFRADGLYAANIEWTPRAFKQIKDREFRFTSPAIMLEETDEMGVMRATEVINVALTNLPATVGQEPLVANSTTEGTSDMKITKEMLASLGLNEDATDEQIAERFSVLAEREKAAEKLEAEKAELVELSQKAAEVAKAKAAEAEKLEAEKAQLLSSAGADDVAALRSTIATLETKAEAADQLSARVSELESEKVAREKQAMLDSLVTAGKLTPAQMSWAETQTAEQLSAFGETAPVVLAGRTERAAAPQPGGPVVLSAIEAEVCAKVGIDPDDYGKFKADERAGKLAPNGVVTVDSRKQEASPLYISQFRGARR